ncbi:MAG: VOC family protein [Rhizobiaceae bacterium]
MTPAILETAIYTNDLDAAEAFYGGLLGLEVVTKKENRHVFFRLETSMLLVFNPKETMKEGKGDVPGHGTTGRGHFCFAASLEEQDMWEAKLNAAGYPTRSVVDWPNGARSIYFDDPAGNSVEFGEPSLWGFLGF